MIGRTTIPPLSQTLVKVSNWIQGWLVPGLLRRRTFRFAFIASLLAVLYWGFIASDRYVSEADVIIQRTDLGPNHAPDFSSILAGMGGGGGRTDQLLLRNYLLSLDMLNKLESKLKLRAHYSDRQHDSLSRMWSKQVSQEQFYQHYLSRVSIELDEYSGVLIIKAQGYDAKTAQAITQMLVNEGERKMNEMAHQLANTQVAFIEDQVVQMSGRFQQTRQDLVRYQNQKGLVSPQSTAEHMAAVINQLEGQRTELQARRAAALAYLAPQAPAVVELDTQLAAIEKQIAHEQKRLTAPNGATLNSVVEEYQRLEMGAVFAQDVYKTALVALEKSRVEATQNLKKVSVLQTPTLPEYAQEPRRIYNIIVFVLVALLLAGIVHLLAAIIRDHKD